jgi:acetyltransferase-like isoleucine patch superfamily enzyme
MKSLRQVLKTIYWAIIKRLPYFSCIYYTKNTQVPIKLKHIVWQKIFRFNKNIPWPVHPSSIVSEPYHIEAGIEVSPGYSHGCYITGMGGLKIGDYTQIAPNVGILTANHDLYDNRIYVPKPVAIGKYCWIGMGALIMPGVVLGDYTIVAAGAVVTKSFPEGYCVVGGTPAKIIKTLEKEKCVFHKSEHEYIGYLPVDRYLKKYPYRFSL